MTVRIINADMMDGLAQLPDESVHCVVTSPPYWGLRDYGTAKWEGGDPECDHAMGFCRNDGNRNDIGGFAGSRNAEGHAHMGKKLYKGQCGKCGATRIDHQLGLEPTLGEYVETMVRVFRQVRRVLRKDGTLWLNLGDCYATGAGKVGNHGLKPKDLCGVPWRVAFALQADGWWLRQDIIWSKPNPMPESIKDRCTKAHEYLFLLAKSERYYFDAEAIAESPTPGKHPTTIKSFGTQAAGAAVKPSGNQIPGSVFEWGETRNKRSVWEIATQPFPEAHFATFPPALVEPCIKAGSKIGDTVLDPFGGSGTTGLVADRLKRNAILIELNPEYAAMAEKRIKGDCPMFAEVGI